MILRLVFPILLLFVCSLRSSTAVKTHGVFYVMGSDGIYVIDPVEKRLVTNITNTSSPGLCTFSPFTRRKCYFNKAFVVDDLLFVANPSGNALNVIDLKSQTKTETIATDPSPYGLYWLPWKKELWVHSWTNSTFDVVATQNRTRTHNAVRAHIRPGWTHGYMLAQENLLDGKTAFVSHLWNPGVHKIDLKAKTYSGFLNMTKQSCIGTYGLAFSAVNKHLFVECRRVRGGSIIELDVRDERIVKNWNIPGKPFVSPDGRFILILYSPVNETLGKLLDSRLNILEIKGSTVSQYPELRIPGGVSQVVFYPKTTGSYYAFVTIKFESRMAIVDLDLAKNGNITDVKYIHDVGYLNTKAHGASRGVFSGGKWIISPASKSKTVVIIDGDTRKVHGTVKDVDGGGFSVWIESDTTSGCAGVKVSLGMVSLSILVVWNFVRKV